MVIERLKANHIENPMGYLMDSLSLSWVVAQAEGTHTVKARVQIALDETMNQLVHDSGEREDISCVDYSPDITLEPGVRYYWQVQAWDDAEDYGKSQVAFFETAAEMKTAAWIKSPFSKEVQALFRKEFTVEKKTVEARMYICGLGLYEAYINGEKIGDEYLAPYYNDYNLWLQYQTYDLTQQLREGDNCIGIMLGNGWYKGRFGFVDRMDELYGDTCHMICELHLTFADGTKQIIPSDTSWLCAPSPVLQSSIYDGEVWDSRKEIPAWAEVSCDAKEFVPSISCEESKKLLTPRLSLPVKIMERIKPVQLIHTVADELVLDFGQEMTGWVEFNCKEPENAEILFQYPSEKRRLSNLCGIRA